MGMRVDDPSRVLRLPSHVLKLRTNICFPLSPVNDIFGKFFIYTIQNHSALKNIIRMIFLDDFDDVE